MQAGSRQCKVGVRLEEIVWLGEEVLGDPGRSWEMVSGRMTKIDHSYLSAQCGYWSLSLAAALAYCWGMGDDS